MSGRARGAIALGGLVGALLRWSVVEAVGPVAGFPWPVFVLNVVGSLVLGAAMVASRQRGITVWRDGVGIGFCGGLTTFSTFAVEAAGLVRDDRAALALGYVSSSVVAAVLAVVAGAALVGGLGGLDAIDDPLESQP